MRSQKFNVPRGDTGVTRLESRCLFASLPFIVPQENQSWEIPEGQATIQIYTSRNSKLVNNSCQKLLYIVFIEQELKIGFKKIYWKDNFYGLLKRLVSIFIIICYKHCEFLFYTCQCKIKKFVHTHTHKLK